MPGQSSSTNSVPGSLQNPDAHNGVLFATAGYIVWGISPLFWKYLEHFSVFEVMFQRIIWSVPILAVWLLLRGRLLSAFDSFRSPKTFAMVVTMAILLCINWSIFIWAVSNNRIMDVSFGYYINPLLNVVIGYVLLKEKLSRAQVIAIGLAAIAIAVQIWNLGALPLASLTLAMAFSFYGLLKKKTANIGAAQGLFIEVILMAPFALAGVYWLQINGQSHFQFDSEYSAIFLMFAGLVTVVPLVLFAAGARRIRLITIGLLQYIGPSINFLIAIFIFNEGTQPLQLLSFCLIWIGLAVFSYDAYKTARSRAAQALV